MEYTKKHTFTKNNYLENEIDKHKFPHIHFHDMAIVVYPFPSERSMNFMHARLISSVNALSMNNSSFETMSFRILFFSIEK